jgi:hypothetical protein
MVNKGSKRRRRNQIASTPCERIPHSVDPIWNQPSKEFLNFILNFPFLFWCFTLILVRFGGDNSATCGRSNEGGTPPTLPSIPLIGVSPLQSVPTFPFEAV